MQYQLFIKDVRMHLVKQAKFELAVIEDEYNEKLEQMGVRGQGRAENPIIITAAKDDLVGLAETPELEKTIKGILRNEVSELGIEYATLVGRDLRIIANANADRVGDEFNPVGLVSIALRDRHQIETNARVSWDELVKESPPLPDQFHNQDGLIRYTAMPVTDPNTKEVLAVLVLGDIVNHKFPIVKNIVNEWDGGYSGVYMLTSSGEFSLVDFAEQAAKNNQSKINQEVHDLAVIEAAATAKGGIVTKRLQKIDGSMYVIAAKAILDFNNQPVAVLVRGTSALEGNGLIRDELLLQLLLCGVIVLFNLLLATIVARFITRPLKGLEKAAHLFAKGNRWIRSKAYAKDEVGRLALEFNKLADSVVRSETRLRKQAQQQQNEFQKTRLLLEEVARSQVRNEQELEEMFSRALVGARKILEVDRLVVYRINHDGSGYISTESVDSHWPSMLTQKIEEACIPKQLLDLYANGQMAPTPNVFEVGFHPDPLKLLEWLQIKASLAEPILREGQLFGLLIAHHCTKTHEWQPFEIDFMRQLSVQLGVALDQLVLIQKREVEANRSHVLQAVNLQIIQAETPTEVMARLPLAQVRQALHADRVIVYRFDQNEERVVTAKSVAKGWLRSLNAQPFAPYFQAGDIEKYRQGHIQVIPNIYEAGLSSHHLNHQKTFAIKANLVVPIRQENNLFGLLIAHQCDAPRTWAQTEINFFQQVVTQIELALNRCELLNQREMAAEIARLLAKRQQQQREKLQHQLIELLSDVGQATTATQSISQIMKTIQLETTQVIEAMKQSGPPTEKETRLMRNTTQNLEKIVAVSRQIDQLMQAISEATGFQTSSALTVKHLIREINPISERPTEDSCEIAQSRQQTAEIAYQLQPTVETSNVN